MISKGLLFFYTSCIVRSNYSLSDEFNGGVMLNLNLKGYTFCLPCCACHCKILQLYSRVRAVSTGLKLRYQIIWIVARLMPFHLAYSHGFITHACLCEKQIYMYRLCFYGSRFSIGLWIDYCHDCDCVHNNREDNVFLIVCVCWYTCWIFNDMYILFAANTVKNCLYLANY